MSFTYDTSTSPTTDHQRGDEGVTQTTARTRQWCERVAQANGLNAEQLDDLKSLVNLSSGVTDGIVRLFVWQQASLYRIMNTVATGRFDVERFVRLCDDVESHLGTAWEVPPNLKVTVKVEMRDMLVDHNQPSYTTMHLDLMAWLRLHKERLGFLDIIGNHSREAILGAYVKKAASNARTSFREVLILSVFGKGKKSLEDATWDIMARFKKGGAGTNLDVRYQIRIALLRRWTYEELRDIMQPEEHHDDAASDQSPSSAEGSAPPAKKRKHDEDGKILKPTVGKVPKGEDFWSKIDRRMDMAITAWGDSFTAPEWREYIDDTVARDRRLFGRCVSGILPAIPVQVTSLTAPTNPLPLPSTLLVSANVAAAPAQQSTPSSFPTNPEAPFPPNRAMTSSTSFQGSAGAGPGSAGEIGGPFTFPEASSPTPMRDPLRASLWE